MMVPKQIRLHNHAVMTKVNNRGQDSPSVASCYHCQVCSILFNPNWHVCTAVTADLTRLKDHAVMTCVNNRGQDSPLNG